jgi:Ca2+-binding EF-hand superfamily protein
MKIPNPEEEVDSILAEVDKNNSGFIDYHGFGLNFRVCHGCSK